jgi:hypothetical protein
VEVKTIASVRSRHNRDRNVKDLENRFSKKPIPNKYDDDKKREQLLLRQENVT